MLHEPTDFERQLMGYGQLTVHIIYFLPDQPRILGPTFTIQMEDIAPWFPALRDYIEFWKREIEGRLHSVQIAHRHLIGPSEWHNVDRLITIN